MHRLFSAGPTRIGIPCFKRLGPSRRLTTGDLSNRIQYYFRDESLGARALDHAFAVPHRRLEFIGDAVLCLLIKEALLDRLSDAAPGELTPMYGMLSNNTFFATLAREIGLQDHIEMACAKAGIMVAKTTLDGALADTFEAVIGAVYMDGGLAEARRVFSGVLGDIDSRCFETAVDFKSAQLIKETVEKLDPRLCVAYAHRCIGGNEHEPVWECDAQIVESDTGCVREVIGTGTGLTTRAASASAASAALTRALDDWGAHPFVPQSVEPEFFGGVDIPASRPSQQTTSTVASRIALLSHKVALEGLRCCHVRIVNRQVGQLWESDALLVDSEGCASDAPIGSGSGPSAQAAIMRAAAAAVAIVSHRGSSVKHTHAPADGTHGASVSACLAFEVQRMGLNFEYSYRPVGGTEPDALVWECEARLTRNGVARHLGSGSGPTKRAAEFGAAVAALLSLRAPAAVA